MNRRKNQKNRLEHDNSDQVGKTSCPTEVTRREFVQYSTFALVGAALSLSLPGCGGGGESGEPERLTFDRTSVEPGQVLGIQSSDSPGPAEIPEDIFSVAVRVDETVTYGLRPIYFREGWIGVVIPPMVQADGSYFDSKDVEVSLTVRGTLKGQGTLAMSQDLSVTGGGGSLLSLLNDAGTELSSVEDEKETLFEDAALLEKWDTMHPVVRDGLDWLSATISSVSEDAASEVTTIEGYSYNVTSQDVSMAELMIENLTTDDEGMANEFLDSMPEPGGAVVKKLTALLGYVVPASFVVMTREAVDATVITSGTGAIAAILSAAVPAACLCVAGDCLRKMAEPEMEEEWIKNGLNWYANVLMNQGLGALNDQVVCDFADDKDALMRIVTQDGIELLDDINNSLWSDVPWSNSTPWSNGTPWSNSTPWSNTQWTNQPWSHTPWNNTTPWSHNPWSHNPWSHTPWNNTAPWGNTPWGNTPWGNTPWGNTPWGNTPWGNTPWNNFVNSGFKKT